ncbi:hypothetical protein AVEN_176245-1 [Araneus ventricosus]|uniref:Uncharacterized protein n=1 Tax=Araneus ventricosus TaxID=182803 RepID=A0A4Y2Q5C3_ARAVE|nr:hypothetical protein AVEN_176245-1 [Araneus ventricosus]
MICSFNAYVNKELKRGKLKWRCRRGNKIPIIIVQVAGHLGSQAVYAQDLRFVGLSPDSPKEGPARTEFHHFPSNFSCLEASQYRCIRRHGLALPNPASPAVALRNLRATLQPSLFVFPACKASESGPRARRALLLFLQLPPPFFKARNALSDEKQNCSNPHEGTPLRSQPSFPFFQERDTLIPTIKRVNEPNQTKLPEVEKKDFI